MTATVRIPEELKLSYLNEMNDALYEARGMAPKNALRVIYKAIVAKAKRDAELCGKS